MLSIPNSLVLAASVNPGNVSLGLKKVWNNEILANRLIIYRAESRQNVKCGQSLRENI